MRYKQRLLILGHLKYRLLCLCHVRLILRRAFAFHYEKCIRHYILIGRCYRESFVSYERQVALINNAKKIFLKSLVYFSIIVIYHSRVFVPFVFLFV